MKATALGAVCFGLVATAGLLAGPGQKGSSGKLINYPAQLQFADRADDAITSDGHGIYKNGVDGVTAVLQQYSDGSNSQFLLEFSAVKGKYPRSITLHYTQPVATSCNPVPANDPVGTVSSTGYMDFLTLGTMRVGAVIAKQGSFHPPVGAFRFADATKVDPVEPYFCGDLFVATRTSATSWTVTTDTTPGQTYYDTAGTPVFADNPEEVGSISQLGTDLGAQSQFIGNYRMPFFATVSCLSATSCPPAPPAGGN